MSQDSILRQSAVPQFVQLDTGVKRRGPVVNTTA
jgi:hypothetical protein